MDSTNFNVLKNSTNRIVDLEPVSNRGDDKMS